MLLLGYSTLESQLISNIYMNLNKRYNMKYPINKLTIGLLSVASVMVVSCTDGYLDTAPSESISPQAAYATTNNARSTLNGIA